MIRSMKINVLFKMKHHKKEELCKARHDFELNAEKTQSEQEFQAAQNVDDLEYFGSNKNEVTYRLILA